MELKLYNTLTRRKEVFTPLDPNNVRMYVCGPTVYDYAHIGNARPVIVFDVLYRLLKHLYPGQGTAADGSRVTYVRNITDIDDKIIARAHELQGERNIPMLEAIRELTEKTNAQFQADVAALGCLPPTHQPRATEYVSQMIAMIEQLIASGHAYAKDGHVLYDVSSKPDYGKLANRSIDEMIAGARVDVAPYKKGPMDFVLWKPSDASTPGWDSPWGRGRPGWHIECSAMGEALLGDTFDIHGGGIDLVFPHHENEIAQSEGVHTDAHGHSKPLANYWMHNGFLQVEGEKMSKSLGNFVTIHELLAQYPGDILRFLMMQTHYRQPINWTAFGMDQARLELMSWGHTIQQQMVFDRFPSKPDAGLDDEFLEALNDDLNLSLAITRLREIHDEARHNRLAARSLLVNARFLGLRELERPGVYSIGYASIDEFRIRPEVEQAVREMKAARSNGLSDAVISMNVEKLSSLGLEVSFDEFGYATIRNEGARGDLGSKAGRLVRERNEARKAKDFKEADRIRAELDAMGIQLKDSRDPTTGEIVTTWELKR